MRHNQNRRSRGRSRKGPNPLTRSYESNGPDVKVRGTAAHVAEKYMSLARDAQASGDVVAAENYLQHAEHYNRIVMAAQTQFQQSQPQYRDEGEEGYDDDRMNGRGRDRFEYNGEGRGDDEGDDRGDMGEGESDRGYRPMQGRQQDQGDRPRGPRPDRFERRDRPDFRDRDRDRDRDRPQRFQQEEGGEAPVEQPAVEAAPPIAEEPQSQPRRRRGRPPRSEANGTSAEADDSTPDGAAALAAFPD